MRFQILKPPSPIMLRGSELPHLDALLLLAPAEVETDSEVETAAMVYGMVTAGICVPFSVRLGDHDIWMMGVVEETDDAPVNPDTAPFVLIVCAAADHDRDRLRIMQRRHFTAKVWQPPIQRAQPGSAVIHPVEVRSTALGTLLSTDAIVGKLRDGRTVVTLDIAGTAISIAFEDTTLTLVRTDRSDPSSNVELDVDVGASYDPAPH